MKEVVAKFGFLHGEQRRRGDRFRVSDQVAVELQRGGLVEVLGDGPTLENPTGGAGEPSSASPAAQVSPQTIAISSVPGVKRRGRPRKIAASS